MVVKPKEKSEKTRQVKNNDKSKKYILRRERNVRIMIEVYLIKRNITVFLYI